MGHVGEQNFTYQRHLFQDELPALLENIPLQTRRQMYYQHNEAPHYFSQAVSES